MAPMNGRSSHVAPIVADIQCWTYRFMFALWLLCQEKQELIQMMLSSHPCVKLSHIGTVVCHYNQMLIIVFTIKVAYYANALLMFLV